MMYQRHYERHGGYRMTKIDKNYRYGVRYHNDTPGEPWVYFALFTNSLDLADFMSVVRDQEYLTVDYLDPDGTVWDFDRKERR